MVMKRAHDAAVKVAMGQCNSFDQCTAYGARGCRRRSAHRVRCEAFVRDRFGLECRWPVRLSIRAGEDRVY
jgi:hypothetical protein